MLIGKKYYNAERFHRYQPGQSFRLLRPSSCFSIAVATSPLLFFKMTAEEAYAVTKFREFLKINTEQPTPDYGKEVLLRLIEPLNSEACNVFLRGLAHELDIQTQCVYVGYLKGRERSQERGLEAKLFVC